MQSTTRHYGRRGPAATERVQTVAASGRGRRRGDAALAASATNGNKQRRRPISISCAITIGDHAPHGTTDGVDQRWGPEVEKRGACGNGETRTETRPEN